MNKLLIAILALLLIAAYGFRVRTHSRIHAKLHQGGGGRGPRGGSSEEASGEGMGEMGEMGEMEEFEGEMGGECGGEGEHQGPPPLSDDEIDCMCGAIENDEDPIVCLPELEEEVSNLQLRTKFYQPAEGEGPDLEAFYGCVCVPEDEAVCPEPEFEEE